MATSLHAYARQMTEPRGRRPSRFIGYPTDSLLAVLPDAESAAKAAAAVKAAGVQLPDMAWYDAAIRAGQVVIMARIRGDDRKAEAARIVRGNGGHFINYYGRFATEEIVRWQGPDPEVHSLLKR